MATMIKVMANTSEIDLGKTYAREFPVDDSQTTAGGLAGIELGSLFAVKGNGASAYYYEGAEAGVGATAIKADADNETKEAVGVIVTTSAKSNYAGLNLDSDYRMKPFGTDHENMTTPPCKKVILNVWDSTAPTTPVFNTSTVALTGTVAIGGNTTVTGTNTLFESELAVGDLIEIDSEIREVGAIASDTSLTVTVAFADTATGKTGYQWTDFNRRVYLSTTAGTFTKIQPITGFKQEVGYIVSGNHVQIDIKKGATL